MDENNMSGNGVENTKNNQTSIKLKAIEIATRAEAKIDSYITANNNKFDTIIASIQELREGQQILFNRWWIVSGGVILILISMNGYLISKLIP